MTIMHSLMEKMYIVPAYGDARAPVFFLRQFFAPAARQSVDRNRIQ